MDRTLRAQPVHNFFTRIEIPVLWLCVDSDNVRLPAHTTDKSVTWNLVPSNIIIVLC